MQRTAVTSSPPGKVRLAAVILGLALLGSAGLAACGNTPDEASPSSRPASVAPSTAGPSPAASPTAMAPATQGPTASPEPSAATAELDVCGLIPQTLLASVLGGEAAFPKAIPAAGWSAGQCAWSGPAASFIVRVGTAPTIAAFGDPAAPDAEAMLAAFAAAADAAGTAKKVQGIGDGAVLGPAGIAAYRDDTYLEVTRLNLTDRQLTDVMKLAIGNL